MHSNEEIYNACHSLLQRHYLEECDANVTEVLLEAGGRSRARPDDPEITPERNEEEQK